MALTQAEKDALIIKYEAKETKLEAAIDKAINSKAYSAQGGFSKTNVDLDTLEKHLAITRSKLRKLRGAGTNKVAYGNPTN